jgi:pimeloyl-ACP methyl ester carboxylesterase
MPFANIDGRPLHYVDQGEGFPVLLGHSYLWRSTMWEPQVAALSQEFRVLVPELWGHGQSGPLPTGSRDLADLSRQNLALLDTLGIQHCAIVGLSVGGMWGAELALAAPDRVKCLVLMDAYLGPEPARSRGLYFAMLDQIEKTGVIAAPLLDAIVPLLFRPGGDTSSAVRRTFRTELQDWPSDRLRDSVVPLGRMIFGRSDARSRLIGLKRESTLLLCGAEDIPRPPAVMQEMADIIGCAYALVPEAGHISNLENAAFVNETLFSTLRKHCG